MKKIFLIISFLILGANMTKAQVYYYYNDNDQQWVYDSYHPFYAKSGYWAYMTDSTYRKNIINAKLKAYHYEKQSYKKGAKTKLVKNDKLFNPRGKSLSNKTVVIKQKRDKIKPKEAGFTVFNANDDVLIRNSYRKGDRLKYRTVNEYDSVGLLKQSVKYQGKKIKYTGRTTYEWFSKGKAKLITYYGRKEYKPRVVSFDCLPEGKNENTRRDTTTICRSTEVDANGNRLEISITRDEKGRECKTITRFNRDNRRVAFESFDYKGIYKYGTEYLYNDKGTCTGEHRYGKEKKMTGGWECTYNEKGKRTSYTVYRGADESQKWLYEYTNDSLMTKDIYLKNKIIKSTSTYTYIGKNKSEEIEIRKEGKRKNQYTRKAYEYDANGNCIKWASFNKVNALKEAETNEFDSQKRIVKEVKFNKQNIQVSASIYQYNDNGMYDKIERYGKEKELLSTTNFTFEYYK